MAKLEYISGLGSCFRKNPFFSDPSQKKSYFYTPVNLQSDYFMKNKTFLIFLFCVFTISALFSFGQKNSVNLVSPGNFITINAGESPNDVVMKAAKLIPSTQQLSWQKMEFIAFAHFGINTFTDKEWGEGTESPSLFDPSEFDARQWVRTYRDAGMKMLIIVAKHHDGFCYWPSKYTDHSVKKSPWKKGKGDVVGDLVAACSEYGLKVGIYLSPWDRHEKTYGNSPAYNKFFINQLKELLTNYGEITEVWFDGACGEGPNGKKQEYDWAGYYKVIRELQPNALIFGMGPDIRWVGTETGYGRESEWSVVPAKVRNTNNIMANSQHPVDNVFVQGDMTDEDLGSAEKIENAQTLLWYPAEADVSIRPGWFYHENQNGQVKTAEELVDIYFGSVGRNCVLLLNVPPDKRGLLRDEDIKSLMGMRKILNQTFEKNLATDALITYENPLSEKPFYTLTNKGLNWRSNNRFDTSTLIIELPTASAFDVVMLQESMKDGQRIEKFRIESWDGKQWVKLTEGTTVGYKRLLRFPLVKTKRLRLTIEKSRSTATLVTFNLYKTSGLPVENK
jgi:alpha-L-fucosidase